MIFKNQLEEKAYDIAKKVFEDAVTIEHNKVLRIESAIFPEVVAFSGPPKKEIDVLTAELSTEPPISVLISCKDYNNHKSEPSHIQEWAAVTNTMNKYSENMHYLGVILCPSGFTSGCEPWATSSNIALIPPLKGKIIKYSEETVIKMFERSLTALKKRILFPFNELLTAPKFYEFSYELTSDFEGYEESPTDERFKLSESGWSSSFGELVSTIVGKTIESIQCTDKYIQLNIEDELIFRYNSFQIIFGKKDGVVVGKEVIPKCTKGSSNQDYPFEELLQVIIGKNISSAADFGTHFEFGINGEFNIGFHHDNMVNIMFFNE